MSGASGDDAEIVAGSTLTAQQRIIITVGLMIATLMQALDTTIANVALPYMQGSLSASYDQVTWVLTSYVVAAAIFTAPVGWLTARFGRKNMFIVCIIGFTVTSMMCGVASSITEMVIDRFLQGMFGAALVPLSQSTMLDIYPPEKRGFAMSIWGMGVMIGPILGPTLGGYLTASYNWRFVFFVNVPFGAAAVLGMLFFLPGDKAGRKMRFDWFGFALLSTGLACLQIMLDRGEELDWLNSNAIIIFAVLAALGFYLFTIHLLMAKEPFIPRKVFGDLNFNVALVMMFSIGVVLLASTALLAPFLENLMMYPVQTAGLILAPRGVGTMAAMLICGRLANRVDPRIFMAFGYGCLAVSIVMLEGWTPAVSESYMIETIVLQGFSTGFVFVPLQLAAFYTLAPALRTQGTSLLSLSRNIGSAIGISVTSAFLDHQTQYEHSVLGQYVTPFARPLQVGGAVSQMLNPASKAGAASLNTIITTQAQIISYADDYKLLLLSTIPAMLGLFLMRGPPRQKALSAAPEIAAE